MNIASPVTPARRMSPRSMALAYRIWADCSTHGWYRPIADIAAGLDVSPERIRRVAQEKGWNGRFEKRPRSDPNDQAYDPYADLGGMHGETFKLQIDETELA